MRLTNTIRTEIIEKALAATFAKKQQAHQKARTAFADALYAREYGKTEKLALKLPAGWTNRYTELTVKHPDFSYLYGRKDGKADPCLKLSKEHCFPMYREEIKIDPKHPLYDRATELADAEVALQKAQDTLRQKLRVLLDSVSTSEKLKAAWPKGAKYVPDEMRASMLPVPIDLPKQIDELMAA